MLRSLIIVSLLLLAIGLRIEHSSLFYDLGRDKWYQMTAAGYLAEGKGITHCIAFPDDIAKVDCRELTWWAAGYPFIVSILYKITGDLVTADFILILFGLATLLFASFRFFSLWWDGTPDEWAFGLFLVFAGFSFTPFNYFQTNDLLSTAFLMLSISESSFALQKRGRSGFFLAGLSMFAAAFFKFSFYPFFAVVPGSLLLLAALRRDLSLLKFFPVYQAPIALCFVLLFAAFPNHVLPPGGLWIYGWNWSNLASMSPFGARALFFIDFLLRRLDPATLFGVAFLALIHAFSIAVVLALVFAAGRYVQKSFRWEIYDGRSFSAISGIVTIAITVAYLSWLSIRLPMFYHPIYDPWTFVQETRYFGPAMMLIIYAMFIIPFRTAREHARIRTLTAILVLAMCSYAVSYWLWKNYDYFYNGRIEGSFAGGHVDDDRVAEFLKNDRSFDRGTTVLGFVSHAGAYGYPTLLVKTDPAKYPFPWFDWHIGFAPISTSSPRTLLVKIPKSPSIAEVEMIAHHNGMCLLRLNNYDLYRLEIVP